MPRRTLALRVEPLELRACPTTFLDVTLDCNHDDGTADLIDAVAYNPPIVHPTPMPVGPAGPAVTYTAAAPYAPTRPY